MSTKSITRSFSARIHFSPDGEDILTALGEYLSTLRNDDYAYLLRCEKEDTNPSRKYRRYYLYSYGLSKRLADCIILSNNEQQGLAKRNIKANIAEWQEDIKHAEKALERGDLSPEKAYHVRETIKNREKKIKDARIKGSSVCFGGKKLAQEITRHPHNPIIRRNWVNRRLFLNFAGESGRNKGNDIIKYRPDTDELWLHLPNELAKTLGLKTKSLIGTAHFKHGKKYIVRCVGNNIATSHEFRWNVTKQYWVLDTTARFTTDEIIRHDTKLSPDRVAGIDFNAGFISTAVTDRKANIIDPKEFSFEGKNTVGDLVLELANYLQYHHVSHVYCERLTGLQRSVTRKNGTAGKLNSTVASMPTGKFAQKLSDLTENRGIGLSFVSPAYTSQLTCQWSKDKFGLNIHLKASYLIVRRGLGLSISRREEKVPSVTTSGLSRTNAFSPLDTQSQNLTPLQDSHDRTSTSPCSALS